MSEKRECKICHCSKIKVCKRGKRGNESAKNNKAKEIESKKTITCANKKYRKQKKIFNFVLHLRFYCTMKFSN